MTFKDNYLIKVIANRHRLDPLLPRAGNFVPDDELVLTDDEFLALEEPLPDPEPPKVSRMACVLFHRATGWQYDNPEKPGGTRPVPIRRTWLETLSAYERLLQEEYFLNGTGTLDSLLFYQGLTRAELDPHEHAFFIYPARVVDEYNAPHHPPPLFYFHPLPPVGERPHFLTTDNKVLLKRFLPHPIILYKLAIVFCQAWGVVFPEYKTRYCAYFSIDEP